MKEVQDIVRAFEEARKEGKQTALATVVHVQGSSYRRPGARMLVTEDGKLTGAISGGCLEGDALRKARLAMVQQKAMLVTYDTTDEDDAKLGVGLGCNGIIQILIEPINPDNPENPVTLLQSFLDNRQHAVLVTLFSLDYQAAMQPGTCLFATEGGAIVGGFQDKSLEKALIADAQEVLRTRTSMTKTYATPQTALTGFVELLKPAVSLIIAGAGNDAIPVTEMAAILGWQTTVVDRRASYATAERFPAAQQVLVAKPEQVLSKIKLDEQTVFVLMTHNYNYDTAMLRQLLPLQMPYVGVLGPKKKLERMLEELQEEGMQLSEEERKSVYGPVGLDVGAETSEEIALAIVSEIKAVLSKRVGTSLRDKQDVIHSREGEKIKQVTLE
ncbi:XdhC family protein [Pontibacter toksunensis]|uniref:XdhC family protein n=1 Tax=Pontibacter toksunensis TaxID=1332631 RepID=A0ABW6BNX9_9BACT